MATSFETDFISQVAEKTPFVDMPTQMFFTEWCRINDSEIIPKFISREEWQERGDQGILEKSNQGKQTLFIPKDLHLWEMMDVVKAVDSDTYVENSDKKVERAIQIQELGVTFEKAGLYLSEYLPYLDEGNGKSMAKDIASAFYAYGLSLQHKKQERGDLPEESSLTEDDKIKLDKWFLGRDAYQKRLARLGENPNKIQIEDTRKKLLQIYFKTVVREGYCSDGEKPWETKVGPMKHLQDRTRRQIINAIERPEREMKTAIFRRGVKKVGTEMKEIGWRKIVNDLLKEFGFDPLLEQRKLYDTLHIAELKQELRNVRQTQNLARISDTELAIAQKIQKAVSRFSYKRDANYPSEIVKTQFMNCVSSAILGCGLLEEVEIKYLQADLFNHSATVLLTSDGKGYWQDFTPGNLEANYTEIRPNMVDGKFDFSNMLEDGIKLHFKEWNPYSHVDGGLSVNLYFSEIGLQCILLNNTGNALSLLDRKEEAIEAYKQAISINPAYVHAHNALGNVLNDLGRKEEAIEAYKQALSIDPTYVHAHNGLGNVLNDLGRKEEAIEAYQQAISIDPAYVHAHNGLGYALSDLGRNDEAIKAYQQAISIDPAYVQAHNALGNVLRDLGKNEEAIKAYKQAISIDPTYVHARNGLGNVLNDLGRNDEAIKAYQQAISIDPTYVHAHNGLGNVLNDLGRNGEAIKAYKKAISIDPTYVHAHNGLGNVLNDLGRNDEAIKAYQQAILIDSAYAYAYNGLGSVFSALGRKEEAIKAYRQAISIDPTYVHAHNGLERVLSDLGRNGEATEV